MKLSRLFLCSLALTAMMFGCSDDSSDDNKDNNVPENTAELCSDDKDNDNNGLKDCEESSCAQFDNCKSTTEKQCSTSMPDGKKDCTCDKTTGQWTNCQDDNGGSTKTPENTAELCKDGIDNDQNGIADCDEDSCAQFDNCKSTTEKQCSDPMPQGKKDCTCDKTTGQWKECKDDVEPDTDSNGNHMKDSKEAHISGAADCNKHSECTDTNFCDHFIPGGSKIGKCADKCTGNDDCMTGFICRPDGRCAAEAFETVWKTTEANEEIELPSGGTDAVCNATIDWGDGSAAQTITECPKSLGALKHAYATAGDHHIKITGTWDGWCMGTGHISATCLSSDDMAAKLIEVVSFGPVGLGVQGFASAKNLAKLSTIDIPDASKLGQKNGTNVYADDMFYYCENLEKGLAKWDVSNVTSLYDFLSGAKKYNENLYGWDVSNVTSFYGMFWGAEALESNPANSWDLTKATTMSRMFSDTTKKSLNFQHTKASKPESITSCDGIKDMYTGSAVDCDIVKIAGEDVPALASCKKKDYKAECN